ncbi:MAG: S41 family peptidase [Solirubrobacterales bacterium]|nr:S41 family peptidase [Solirubrobacterales bacterium]
MNGRWLLASALVGVAFVAGAVAGERSDGLGGFINDVFGTPNAELSSNAIDVIEDNYWKPVGNDELNDASVDGMVRELRRRHKDPFSHYFDAKAFGRFQEVTEGSFSGVGLSVTQNKRGLGVAMVFKGSPAQEAGIRAGNVVVAVDGKSIAGEDADLAAAQIKGEPGTEVTLTVVRPSGGGKRELTLEREQLQVPVVDGRLLKDDGHKVGYVQLVGFPTGAHAELRSEVERLEKRGAEGIVLDLRGNPGGLLTEAVLTSSVFIQDGPIVTTKGRTQGETTYEAEGDSLARKPMTVLINGDTASSAEILASALAEAGVAKTVGEDSFGKGVYQQVIPLDGGGALDLTVGEYLTRDGTSLAGKGIKPDVPVKDRPGSPDESLQRALQVLAGQL